ncbi:hypothetical protein D3C80_837290 [compost metagenome]
MADAIEHDLGHRLLPREALGRRFVVDGRRQTIEGALVADPRHHRQDKGPRRGQCAQGHRDGGVVAIGVVRADLLEGHRHGVFGRGRSDIDQGRVIGQARDRLKHPQMPIIPRLNHAKADEDRRQGQQDDSGRRQPAPPQFAQVGGQGLRMLLHPLLLLAGPPHHNRLKDSPSSRPLRSAYIRSWVRLSRRTPLSTPVA